jgi:hypothetical protein
MHCPQHPLLEYPPGTQGEFSGRQRAGVVVAGPLLVVVLAVAATEVVLNVVAWLVPEVVLKLVESDVVL